MPPQRRRTAPKRKFCEVLSPGSRPIESVVYLKTLGHPALHLAGGAAVPELRKKDLALLVYLCVEDAPVHPRGRLAALLWDADEKRSRHSLTQAVRRLVRALPPGTLTREREVVRWNRGLACDAKALLRGEVEPGRVDDEFSLYAGDFLEGFHAGRGAGDFEHWADRRRVELRDAAMLVLESAGQDAERGRAWGRALRLAERGVQIDPFWEQGHRRLMRALAARGERNRALRHYQRFEGWLAREENGAPDPETQALAEHLRDPDASAAGADTPSASPADPASTPPPARVQPASTPEPAASVAEAPPGPLDPSAPGEGVGPDRGCSRGRVAAWAVVLALVLLMVCLLAAAEGATGSAAAEEHPALRGDPPARHAPRKKR